MAHENNNLLSTRVFHFSSPNEKNRYVNLLGHWVYDGTQESFLLDQISAATVEVDDYHKWQHASFVTRNCSAFDIARFNLNMQNASLGNVIFERVTFVSGPYQGETFIVQGAVLERDEQGKALWATGYVSHERSPHSEFIAREMSGDGIFIWNGLDDDDVICSASMHIMLGYQEAEFPRKFIDVIETLVHPDDNDFLLVIHQVKLSNQYGDYFESCMRIRHKDGHYIWAICRCLVQERNEQGVAIRGIGSITNINLISDSFENIKLMMFTDSLTGLHNRNYLQQNALRYEECDCAPLSIIFLDVSGLKLTNDILGHSYGDYLLTHTRDIINQAVKSITGNELQMPITNKHHHDEFVSPLPEHYFGPNNNWNDTAFCSLQSSILKAHEIREQRLKESGQEGKKFQADHVQFARERMSLLHGLSDPIDDSSYEKAAARTAPKASCGMELMRLAGDEFLLIMPKCSEYMAQKILLEIIKIKEKSNRYQRDHVPINDRPVPLCFGIGYATWGDLGNEQDNLKTLIDRADERMQKCKDERRAHDYQKLKEYFELKKGRTVSMRDERRVEIFNSAERERKRSDNMML